MEKQRVKINIENMNIFFFFLLLERISTIETFPDRRYSIDTLKYSFSQRENIKRYAMTCSTNDEIEKE